MPHIYEEKTSFEIQSCNTFNFLYGIILTKSYLHKVCPLIITASTMIKYWVLGGGGKQYWVKWQHLLGQWTLPILTLQCLTFTSISFKFTTSYICLYIHLSDYITSTIYFTSCISHKVTICLFTIYVLYIISFPLKVARL